MNEEEKQFLYKRLAYLAEQDQIKDGKIASLERLLDRTHQTMEKMTETFEKIIDKMNSVEYARMVVARAQAAENAEKLDMVRRMFNEGK